MGQWSKEKHAEYRKRPEVVAKTLERWSQRHLSPRGKALAMVRKAVDAGLLVRPDTCSRCNAASVQICARHNDYSKPCDVTWLCRKCLKPAMPPRTPDYERFLSKVIPEPNSGCWLWAGHVTRRYGKFSAGNANVSAHRWSYFFHFPGQDQSLHVCHKCDNPICVNPQHLFLGTMTDNIRDCFSKGRGWRGGSNTYARRDLTHCKHGHPFSGENLIITPKGRRACRVCRSSNYGRSNEVINAARRERKRRQRAACEGER